MTLDLQAIKARAEAATRSVAINERGPWAALADIPALVAEVERLQSSEGALAEMALRLAYDHWARTGHPIRPQDRALVVADARRALEGA